jgi:hypothetical protein
MRIGGEMTRAQIEFRLGVNTAKRKLLSKKFMEEKLTDDEIKETLSKIDTLTRKGMALWKLLPEYADIEKDTPCA